ncbi:hypothetical protein SAMN05518861_109180 [Mesorhizobium sp. YR577]|nr:hypothetical protein SAMN05518861_109180 [Mesorhizobium sp. YR577]
MREVGAILPDPEFLPFMKRTSAGTPSLILRCERSEPRRTRLFIATPAFASGHCQRAGKDGRPKSRSSFVFSAISRPPVSVSVPKSAGHNARSMYIPWTRRRGFSASCAICPWSFRHKLIACSFQPGHAAAGRRPVSGPRVPGYHTRAGGHRRSPRSRFQNPVPQERWGDYVRGVLGWGKIGGEKMCGVSGNNGLVGNWVKIFPPQFPLVSASAVLHRSGFIDVPAWIPGFLRRTTFGSGPEDDELGICVSANHQRLRLAASPNAIRHSRPRERGTSGECRESMPERWGTSAVQNARQHQDGAVPDDDAANGSPDNLRSGFREDDFMVAIANRPG